MSGRGVDGWGEEDSLQETQRDQGCQGDRGTSILFLGGSLKKGKNLQTDPFPEQQMVRFMDIRDTYLWHWGMERKEDLQRHVHTCFSLENFSKAESLPEISEQSLNRDHTTVCLRRN